MSFWEDLLWSAMSDEIVKSLKLKVKSRPAQNHEIFSDSPLLFLVVLLLLLAAWLGARSLNADAIWYDEYWSIYDAGGAHYGPLSPAQIWERVGGRNPWHAPGYFFLLGAWGSFTGWTAFAARSLSLLVGLLTIAWTYRLGKAIASPLVGISAATLLGASALYASYLHELRAYTLYTLFTVVTLWAYWQVVFGKHKDATLGYQIALVLGALGLVYTHYFAALTAVAIAVYHLLFVRKDRGWWQVVMVMGASGILFLPWLSVMLQAIGLASADLGRQWRALDTSEILTTLLYAFGNGFVPLTLILCGAALFARTRAAGFAWFTALAVLVMGLVINLFLPVIAHIRYLIALWPVLSVVAAFGVERLARWRIRPAIILGVWIAAGIWNSVNPAFIDDLFRSIHLRLFRPDLPWQIMTKEIADNVQSGDAVAFHIPRDEWAVSNVFDYYMHPLPVQATFLEWLPGLQEDGSYYAEAQSLLTDRARVWLGNEQNREPTFRLSEFQRALQEGGYVPCGRMMDAPNMSLDLYAMTPDCCYPPGNAPDTTLMHFGAGVALRSLKSLEVRPDGNVGVVLGWSVGRDFLYQNYSVALHVLDAEGNLAAQVDYGLPPDAYACRASHIPLAELAPGEYTLAVIVYNWSDGARLTGIVEAGGETGERLPLGGFEVQ